MRGRKGRFRRRAPVSLVSVAALHSAAERSGRGREASVRWQCGRVPSPVSRFPFAVSRERRAIAAHDGGSAVGVAALLWRRRRVLEGFEGFEELDGLDGPVGVAAPPGASALRPPPTCDTGNMTEAPALNGAARSPRSPLSPGPRPPPPPSPASAQRRAPSLPNSSGASHHTHRAGGRLKFFKGECHHDASPFGRNPPSSRSRSRFRREVHLGAGAVSGRVGVRAEEDVLAAAGAPRAPLGGRAPRRGRLGRRELAPVAGARPAPSSPRTCTLPQRSVLAPSRLSFEL